MARRNVSQQMVADWLGIQQPAVSQKLNAKRPFDTDELGIIAEQMNVPVAALTAEPTYAGVPFQGGGIKEAGRPEGRPAEVAGAGFEPATSGICRAESITAVEIAAMLADAEAHANGLAVTS